MKRNAPSPDVPAEQSTYLNDPAAWAIAQAKALRDRDVENLDWENLADEILDVAKAEERELGRRVSSLMASLAKIKLFGGAPGHGNVRLVHEHRKLVKLQLKDTPSLHGRLVDADWLSNCWSNAIISMAAAGLPVEALPEENPWNETALMDDFVVE